MQHYIWLRSNPFIECHANWYLLCRSNELDFELRTKLGVHDCGLGTVVLSAGTLMSSTTEDDADAANCV